MNCRARLSAVDWQRLGGEVAWRGLQLIRTRLFFRRAIRRARQRGVRLGRPSTICGRVPAIKKLKRTRRGLRAIVPVEDAAKQRPQGAHPGRLRVGGELSVWRQASDLAD